MKIKVLIIILVAIASALIIWRYIASSIYRSKAAAERVNIGFMTNNAVNFSNLQVGQTFQVDVTMQSNSPITGADLNIVYYNASTGLAYDPVNYPSKDLNSYFEEKLLDEVHTITESNILKQLAHTVYVTKKPPSQLSKLATLRYTFIADHNGPGIVRLRPDLSQVVGVGGQLQICKVGSVNCGANDADNDIALTNIMVGATTSNSSVGSSSTTTSTNTGSTTTSTNVGSTTTNTSTTTTSQTATGNIQLTLNLKFQGISGKPANNADIPVNVRLANGPNHIGPTGNNIVLFHYTQNGIYQGTASFNVPAGAGYRVLLKGAKHVQKKICDPTPSESQPGIYSCTTDGAITLQDGTNTLDFTGVYMLTGDLNLPGSGQDGVVDSSDISFIRQHLGSTAKADLDVADLNQDGVINQIDMGLVLSALSIKVDEG